MFIHFIGEFEPLVPQVPVICEPVSDAVSECSSLGLPASLNEELQQGDAEDPADPNSSSTRASKSKDLVHWAATWPLNVPPSDVSASLSSYSGGNRSQQLEKPPRSPDVPGGHRYSVSVRRLSERRRSWLKASEASKGKNPGFVSQRNQLREMVSTMMKTMTQTFDRSVWHACDVLHPDEEIEQAHARQQKVLEDQIDQFKGLKPAIKGRRKSQRRESTRRSFGITAGGSMTAVTPPLGIAVEKPDEKVLAHLAKQTNWSVLDVEEVWEVFSSHAPTGRIGVWHPVTRGPAVPEVAVEARLKHGKRPLNYGFFAVEDDTQTPRRLESLTGLSGMILAFEGGSFVWPGVRVGFRRNMTIRPLNAPPIELQMETRSLQPLVVEISSFLDASDCQHIIDKALPHVEKSTVKHMDHDVGKPDANWRTSSTYFMPSDDDVLRRIDDRVSALTLVRKSHQELAQILRYQKGEQYVGHTDYFDVEMYANDQQIQSMTKQGLFNRLATVFFYLTDVEEGGETNFPRTDGLPQPVDFSDCSKGISVHPKRGRIIIFYSLHPSGEADEYSLHAGCEVKQGTKWSANKWIWNKPMNYVSE
eukprot:s103_g10.t1